MPLTSGTRLGPYEVVSAIGAGGMGEVYRARDTTLHRDVAIKVLPDDVASDPERLTRFQREAEVLAALNHPNIASIYGVEESAAGGRALVMELVDGPTLADRLSQGTMPLTEALHIARQIADALEAAHDRGIVHRDLKPSNIKLTPDGAVKLLDFGLAKSFSGPGAQIGSDASNSPTVMPASIEGGILGTAAYMSPEQASGRQVDRRADIWAFGVVLFEMLSGRPLFRGETTAHLLAEVLKSDPPWEALPTTTPPDVRDLLERCLRKSPRARLRDIGDARTQIDDWLARPEKTRFTTTVPVRARHWPSMAIAAGSLVTAAAAVGFMLWRQPAAATPPARTWEFAMGDYEPDFGEFSDGPAISPNGTMIAFGGNGRGRLRVRDLDSLAVRELPGTEGARQPFWSPDAAFIGYHVVQGAQASVWKVEPRGASPIKICDAPPGIIWTASWGQGHAIWLNMVYGPEAGELFTVADRGGTPTRFIVSDDKRAAVFSPRALPDGDLLFQRVSPGASDLVMRRKSGESQVVMQNTRGFFFMQVAPGGHVIHADLQSRGLWATRFDASPGSLVGEPMLISQSGTVPTVSADGTLVYKSMTGGSRQLAWVDRTGGVLGSIGQPQDDISSPALAPDGTRVAVGGVEQDDLSIWIHDAVRGTKSRVSFGSEYETAPSWAPGGDRLAIESNYDVVIQQTDATGQPETMAGGSVVQMSPAWSRDGRSIVFVVFAAATQFDVWVQPVGDKSPARAFLATPFNEKSASLSPDGRHLIYVSDESGRDEVYVREFPGGQGKQQVSVSGGTQPKWSARGDELFFVASNTLMAAPVQRTPVFSTGVPTALFTAATIGASAIDYDVAADGKRFVVVRTLKAPERHAVVVENWLARVTGRAGGR